jgi:hypothetical protein
MTEKKGLFQKISSFTKKKLAFRSDLSASLKKISLIEEEEDFAVAPEEEPASPLHLNTSLVKEKNNEIGNKDDHHSSLGDPLAEAVQHSGVDNEEEDSDELSYGFDEDEVQSGKECTDTDNDEDGDVSNEDEEGKTSLDMVELSILVLTAVLFGQ